MTVPDVISPPRPTRVLIVSDIGLYRDGIARVLEHDAGMDVVARAPDIALVDATMRTSLAAVRSVRERWPDCRVIVLSVSDVEGDVLRFAEAGVAGYLPSTACKGDLVAAIESVERGEAACSPRAAAALLRRVAGLPVAIVRHVPNDPEIRSHVLLAQYAASERYGIDLIDPKDA